MILTAYGYFAIKGDWNTDSRLSMVKAIVEENRFEIDAYRSSRDFFTRDAAKVSGHYYSDKAIGASLIGIAFYNPIYGIARASGSFLDAETFKELMTFLVISLLCAFLGPLLYSFSIKICNDSRFALLLTVAICLGTGLYTYSAFYYAHSLVGLFLFVIFFIWFHIKGEDKINPIKVMISGYLMGYAIITEYPTVAIVFLLGLYILYILWQKKQLSDIKIYVRLLIGFSIPIILALTYNTVIFHGPFKTGYNYEMLPIFHAGHATGFMGIGWPDLKVIFYMTFHPTMGIFLQSPFMLFALIGWVRMWKIRPYRAEALLSFGIISAYFLLMSGYYQWWGSASFMARNVIPVLPFWIIPLSFITQKWEKLTILFLTLISIAHVLIVTSTNINNDFYAIMINMPKISIDGMFQQPSTIYNGYLPSFLKQNLAPNRGQQFLHLKGFSSLIPLAVIEAALLILFLKITSTGKNISASPIREVPPTETTDRPKIEIESPSLSAGK